jgi:hypothetical protein
MTASDPVSRLRSILRDIREDLVRVDAALDRCGAASAVQRAEAWAAVRPLVAGEALSIDQRLARIADLIGKHDALANQCSDAVTRIENIWQDFTRAWDTDGGAPPEVAVLRAAIAHCVLEIGYLTVPDRANRVLRSLRVGAAMKFHKEFADEIPSHDARATLLRWLHAHPRLVGGVVDVHSGVIIRASSSPRRRLLSWVMMLAVMAVAVVGAGFAPDLLRLAAVGSVPPGGSAEYVWAVLFAYAGAVAHVGIAALKQLRRAGGPEDQRFTAIGNFTIWVHINEMYLMLYGLAIPVVAYVVMLSTGRIDNVTMAFVGFSIDSLLDVVLSRFDKAATGRTEAIADALA